MLFLLLYRAKFLIIQIWGFADSPSVLKFNYLIAFITFCFEAENVRERNPFQRGKLGFWAPAFFAGGGLLGRTFWSESL